MDSARGEPTTDAAGSQMLHRAMAGLCCCIPLISQHRRNAAISIEEKSIGSSSTEPVDLVRDEGSSVQDELWLSCVESRKRQAKTRPNPFFHDVARHETSQSALRSLTDQYTSHGYVAKLPRIKAVLSNFEPFVKVIQTMVQSDPSVAALVWGSVQLILSCIMKMEQVFDDMGSMLLSLSKILPRLEAYVQILHTPRLHEALREVYGLYVDFSFLVIDFLKSNQCSVMFRVQWAAVGRQFEEVKGQLHTARTDFDEEVNLATVQVQAERHQELLQRIPSGQTQSGVTINTVMAPRNRFFTGREGVLASIHTALSPILGTEADEGDDPESRGSAFSRRSCSLHGVAGMGKTETALEYTYRYRASYSHIFWIHAQSESTLLESFIDFVHELGIGRDEDKTAAKVRRALDWLRCTDQQWLLVFDNVESYDDVRRFWPAGVHGSILVTTQSPITASICDTKISLPSMSPEEGSSLIQSCLSRGKSETSEAKALSQELGGYPLAIAHFAGYVTRSQCTIQHILDTLRKRLQSSQIWAIRTPETTGSYGHTVATVWQLAWARIPDDSRTLLRYLSFLTPDAVPEDIFVKRETEKVDVSGWQHWDSQRLNEAVRALHERNLIERDATPLGTMIRTHRHLQRSILYNLDDDFPLRQRVFEEVVQIICGAFPTQSVKNRGDPSNWAASRRIISQVISLNAAVTQSEPRMGDHLPFAKLLSEAGEYLFNDGVQADAVPLFETSESICERLVSSDDKGVFPVLTDTLGILQIYNQFMGEVGRRRALRLTNRVLGIRLMELEGVPQETWTEMDFIKVARSYVDRGCASSQLNRMDEAARDFDEGLRIYSLRWTEETLPSRFGHLYSCRIWALATTGMREEAVDLANRSVAIIVGCYGPDHHLTTQTKYRAALVFFAVGDIKQALAYHKEVFEARRASSGPDSQETLASQYNLAVSFQNMGDFESAEHHLRENLTFDRTTIQWRDEDRARSKFRLAVVLTAQNRPNEAKALRKDALQTMESMEGARDRPTTDTEAGDERDMEWLDLNVALWHGRTTGPWSDGLHW